MSAEKPNTPDEPEKLKPSVVDHRYNMGKDASTKIAFISDGRLGNKTFVVEEDVLPAFDLAASIANGIDSTSVHERSRTVFDSQGRRVTSVSMDFTAPIHELEFGKLLDDVAGIYSDYRGRGLSSDQAIEATRQWVIITQQVTDILSGEV